MNHLARLLSLLAFLAYAGATHAASTLRDEVLVTPAWLASHLQDADLVLLHAGDEAGYAEGHIAGARLVSFATLSAPRTQPSDLIQELPSPALLRDALQALGVSAGSRIVVYFAKDDVPAATRVLYTLEVAGLGGRASLLDGGLTAWVRAGHPTSRDAPTVTPGSLAPLRLQSRAVDAAWLQGRLRDPRVDVIDARDTQFYDGSQAGRVPGVETKGHLPGAKSIPFRTMTSTDLTLKPAGELAAAFEAAGVAAGDQVVVYCHVGQQATTVLLAARTLGIDAVLYDGSFQDWAQRGLPVELPPGSAPPAR